MDPSSRRDPTANAARPARVPGMVPSGSGAEGVLTAACRKPNETQTTTQPATMMATSPRVMMMFENLLDKVRNGGWPAPVLISRVDRAAG